MENINPNIINLCIAIFGSLAGAIGGCWLSYVFLQRKADDAVKEYIAVMADDDIRRYLLKMQEDGDTTVKRLILNSGAEFLINEIVSMAPYTFTANFSRMDAGWTRAQYYGVGIFRYTAVSFIHDKEKDK